MWVPGKQPNKSKNTSQHLESQPSAQQIQQNQKIKPIPRTTSSIRETQTAAQKFKPCPEIQTNHPAQTDIQDSYTPVNRNPLEDLPSKQPKSKIQIRMIGL